MAADIISLIFYYGFWEWIKWLSVFTLPLAGLFWLAYKGMNKKVDTSWVWGLAALMALLASCMITIFTVLPKLAENGSEVGLYPISSTTLRSLPKRGTEIRFIALANEQRYDSFDLIDEQDKSNQNLALKVLSRETKIPELIQNHSGAKWECGAWQDRALQDACKTLHREYLKKHYGQSPLNEVSRGGIILWILIPGILCIICCWVHGYMDIKVLPCSVEPKSHIARAALRKKIH